MTNKNNKSNETYREVSLWRLKTIISVLLHTENFNLCSRKRLLEIETKVESMSVDELDSVILSIAPHRYSSGDKNCSSIENRIYKRIKTLTILRYEILRMLHRKGGDTISVETCKYISDVLNFKICSVDDINHVIILYNRVIDLVLPHQCDKLQSLLDIKSLAVEPLNISNRLYGYLRFSCENPLVPAECIIDVVNYLHVLMPIFDRSESDDTICSRDVDTYVNLLNWIPTSVDDFSTLQTAVKILRENF